MSVAILTDPAPDRLSASEDSSREDAARLAVEHERRSAARGCGRDGGESTLGMVERELEGGV